MSARQVFSNKYKLSVDKEIKELDAQKDGLGQAICRLKPDDLAVAGLPGAPPRVGPQDLNSQAARRILVERVVVLVHEVAELFPGELVVSGVARERLEGDGVFSQCRGLLSARFEVYGALCPDSGKGCLFL